MERNSNAVFSSNVQPYPLYSEKPYMTFHQASNSVPITNYNQQPQYLRSNVSYIPQGAPQVVPVQNYRVSATSPIRVSQAVLQPQVIGPQAGAYYGNPHQSVRMSYLGDPNVVGVAMPQVNQSVVRRKMVPVVQYVPVDVVEQGPMIYNNSAVYAEPVQQRVIVDEPEIYERREIKYTLPPAKVAAAPKPEAKQVDNYRDPMVQTVPKSFDGASVRSSRIAPPPATPHQIKTPCSTWILALLGLLGLIGLILALVLSQNSKSSSFVENTSPTVSDPQKINSAAPVIQPQSVAPKNDLSNAEVKGQTAVTAPLSVRTTEPVTNPTAVAPLTTAPTDISVSQPATNTLSTTLSGIQPQTTNPTYVSASTPASSTFSTAVYPNATATTQPSTASSTNVTSAQPQPTSAQPAATSSTINTTIKAQPTSVQPITVPFSMTANVQSSTSVPSTTTASTPNTVQPATVASSGTSGRTDSIAAGSTNTATAPTSTAPLNSNTATTTTTTTATTKTMTSPAHFLALRHHL